MSSGLCRSVAWLTVVLWLVGASIIRAQTFQYTSTSLFTASQAVHTATKVINGYSESPLPTIIYNCVNLPGICENVESVRQHGVPLILHSHGDSKAKNRRRAAVCNADAKTKCLERGKCDSRFGWPVGAPIPSRRQGKGGNTPLQEWRISCDEFPPASTLEGEPFPNRVAPQGANTYCVATRENESQGILHNGLAALISQNPANVRGRNWKNDGLVHPFIVQLEYHIPPQYNVKRLSSRYAGVLHPGGAAYTKVHMAASMGPCTVGPVVAECPAFFAYDKIDIDKSSVVHPMTYTFRSRTMVCPRTADETACGTPLYRRNLGAQTASDRRSGHLNWRNSTAPILLERQVACPRSGALDTAPAQAAAAAGESIVAEATFDDLPTLGATALLLTAARHAIDAVHSAATMASAFAARQAPSSAYAAALTTAAAAEAALAAIDPGVNPDVAIAGADLGSSLGQALVFIEGVAAILNGTSPIDDGRPRTSSTKSTSPTATLISPTAPSRVTSTPASTFSSTPSKIPSLIVVHGPTTPAHPTMPPGRPTAAPSSKPGRYESMQLRALEDLQDIAAINAWGPAPPSYTARISTRPTAEPAQRRTHHRRIVEGPHKRLSSITLPKDVFLWDFLREIALGLRLVSAQVDIDGNLILDEVGLHDTLNGTTAPDSSAKSRVELVPRQHSGCPIAGCSGGTGTPRTSASCGLALYIFMMDALLKSWRAKHAQFWEQQAPYVPDSLAAVRKTVLSQLAPGNSTAGLEFDDAIFLWRQLAGHMHDADFYDS